MAKAAAIHIDAIWFQIFFGSRLLQWVCQVPIKKQHKKRTGYTVPLGCYEFNRLSSSPSNFQGFMDIVLRNLIGMELMDSLMASSYFPSRQGSMLRCYKMSYKDLKRSTYNCTQGNTYSRNPTCNSRALYPLLNKNQAAGNFLRLELEVTWRTVAIIIRDVLLSPNLWLDFHSLISIPQRIY
jgi:hypothetical protein